MINQASVLGLVFYEGEQVSITSQATGIRSSYTFLK